VPDYNSSVFINCPFDADFAPLLEAMLFCVVRAGLYPRLASERLEAGENRLDKILEIIEACKFSVHDLSMAVSSHRGETFRMNMPFELGLDMGRRRAPDPETNNKRFIIFEKNPYELKRSLSDLAGVDPVSHKSDFRKVIRELRNFLRVEAGIEMPGATALENEYYDFQGWMMEKKISEGHSEADATSLPTLERLEEMKRWNEIGRPTDFIG
jgi:predicted nucleotide-binding protein